MNTDDLLKALCDDDVTYNDIWIVKQILSDNVLYLWAQIGIEKILGGEY